MDKVWQRFLTDLALAIVTLGFYMPYWLYRQNEDIRDAFTDPDPSPNVWWLAGGSAMSTAFALAFGGDPATEGLAAAGSTVGVCIFLVGCYILAENARIAALSLEMPTPVPPWLFVGALGLVFVGIEVGNVVPSWAIRGPVLALIFFALPVAFFRMTAVMVRIREKLAADRAAGLTS